MTIPPITLQKLKDAIHRGERITFSYQPQAYNSLALPPRVISEALPIDIDRRMTLYLITKYGDEIAKKIRYMSDIVVHRVVEGYVDDQYDKHKSKLIRVSGSTSYLLKK